MYDESQRAFLYPRFIYFCGFPINSHKRRKDPHSIAVATYVWKKARQNWKIIYRRTYVEGLRSARFSLSCPSARFYRRFAHGSSYPHLYSLSERRAMPRFTITSYELFDNQIFPPSSLISGETTGRVHVVRTFYNDFSILRWLREKAIRNTV